MPVSTSNPAAVLTVPSPPPTKMASGFFSIAARIAEVISGPVARCVTIVIPAAANVSVIFCEVSPLSLPFAIEPA